MTNTHAAYDLTGRVIVLTGGAGILGHRLALSLAGNGARLAIVDIDADRVELVARNISDESGASGDAVRGYCCDITSREQTLALQQLIERELGAVDVLINNAAAKSRNFFAPFESFPLQDWNEVMNVNLTGAVLCCQIFGGTMARLGRGSIINTLSIYGVVAPDQRIYEGSMYKGHPINTPAVYSASKAALLGLTRYLAAYWGLNGVRVNAITPGGIFSGQNEVFVKKYSARVPLGRMAMQDEMSGAVLFLASDASSYVTGHNLVVDGGLTVW